jgi:host factor-I protein
VSLHSQFLEFLLKGQSPVTVFLTNGVKLSGLLTCADETALTLARDGITQLVMVKAIATVMPQDAFDISEIFTTNG